MYNTVLSKGYIYIPSLHEFTSLGGDKLMNASALGKAHHRHETVQSSTILTTGGTAKLGFNRQFHDGHPLASGASANRGKSGNRL